jgi:hypothetical protein
VRGQYSAIQALGAEVVVVSFEPAARLPGYRELHGWPFPVVSDPERVAYRAFGLESAGWRDLLAPRVLKRYAQLLLQGYRVRWSGADLHQLGGDFVIDRGRRLIYAHRSLDPADRPPVSELLSALRSPEASEA